MLSFRFSGLREFDRMLGKADKALRTELRRDLKQIADVVAQEARSIAESKGLRRSGDLIRGIKPFALTGRAGVRSSAIHRGYPYPKRLEFENRIGAKYGARASLYPALEAKEGEIDRQTERLLDKVADDLAR